MFYPSLPSALAAFSQWRAAVFAVLLRLQQIVCLPGEEPVAPASNYYGSAGMHRLQQHDLPGKGQTAHEQAQKNMQLRQRIPGGLIANLVRVLIQQRRYRT